MTPPKPEQGPAVALIRMDRDGNIVYGGEQADILRLVEALLERFGESDE
jgi:hypothetical protein